MFAKLLGEIMIIQALQVLAIANKHNHSKVLLFLLYTQLLAKNSNLAKDCKIDKAKLFS